MLPEIKITPGQSGFEVTVWPYTAENVSHHVSDRFDLHTKLDQIFDEAEAAAAGDGE